MRKKNRKFHWRRAVPIVKVTIEGREYSFAPLKIKQMRQLAKAKDMQAQNLYESMDLWKPYLEWSMKGAGNEMPDFEDLDAETGVALFAGLIRGVMEASGVKMASVGEARPAGMNGTTSSGSLSPQPIGVSTISTSSPSTT
jgi:hypothetical protein